MRYEAAHKEQTRERVLAAAVTAIRESGTQGVGVASVMERAGLTHGAFYAHFASRDALLLAAVTRLFDAVRGRFDQTTSRGEPTDALRAYVAFYLSPKHRDSTALSCPLALLAGEAPRLGDDTKLQFGSGVEHLTSAISGHLVKLDVPDPAAAAASVVAELVGALAISRAVNDRRQSDTILSRSRRSILARLGLEESRHGR